MFVPSSALNLYSSSGNVGNVRRRSANSVQFQGRISKEAKANGWKDHPWYKKIQSDVVKTAIIFSPLFLYGISKIDDIHRAMRPQTEVTSTQIESLDSSDYADISKEVLLTLLSMLGLIILVTRYENYVHRKNGPDENLKRTAYHELGHLVACLAQKISVSDVAAGTDEALAMGDMGIVWRDSVPNDDLDNLRKNLIIHKAGEEMEKLILGAPKGGLEDDIGKSYQAVTEYIKNHPRDTLKVIKLWLDRSPATRKILTSFNKATVDELAEKLMQERSWDFREIFHARKRLGLVEKTEPISIEELQQIWENFKKQGLSPENLAFLRKEFGLDKN